MYIARQLTEALWKKINYKWLPSRSRSDTKIVDTASLHGIYMALLGRPADEMAQKIFSEQATYQEVIQNVLCSNEFHSNLARLLSIGRGTDKSSHSRDTEIFYSLLNRGEPDQNFFIDLMNRHTYGGDYYEFHRKRFAELHCFLSRANDRRPITRLLEISTMPFTTDIYSRYMQPSLEISTIDLPAAMGGPDESRVKSWGAVTQHISVDLNTANLAALQKDLTMSGAFDVVVASEVVEHLQRDFAEVAEFITKCLSDEGIAIVTTPNYLSAWRMRVIADGQSPQQRFTNFRGNEGGHYHYREYTMKELASDIRSIGAHVLHQIYSNCYDINERFVFPSEYALRDCLIVIFGRTEHPQTLPFLSESNNLPALSDAT